MVYLKTCKLCGCAFESEARNTRYCSEACKAKASKKTAAKRKRRIAKQELTGKAKDTDLLIQKAYKLSREVAEAFLPKVCKCGRCHDENTELFVHHIDHNVMNMQPSNLVWLCQEAHTDIHTVEADIDLTAELNAYTVIKEQVETRARNAAKRAKSE